METIGVIMMLIQPKLGTRKTYWEVEVAAIILMTSPIECYWSRKIWNQHQDAQYVCAWEKVLDFYFSCYKTQEKSL